MRFPNEMAEKSVKIRAQKGKTDSNRRFFNQSAVTDGFNKKSSTWELINV
jgi:hypothetical protein